MIENGFETIPLVYAPADWERWKKGLLFKKWHKECPALFDELNVSNAAHQPHYHFSEWMVARHLFLEKGLLSLNQKYLSKNHGRIPLLQKFIKPDDLRWMQDVRNGEIEYAGHSVMPPDLFVYRYKPKMFYFVETKREDNLTKNQILYFKDLEKRLKAKVLVYQLVEEDPVS